MSLNITRIARVFVAAAVMAATPAVAGAAENDSTAVSGTLNAGQLSISAPADIAFPAVNIGGNASYVLADDFASWSVADATGSLDGWTVAVSAGPVMRGVTAVPGADLQVARPSANSGGPLDLAFTAGTMDPRDGSGSTIVAADAGDGAGAYLFNGASTADNGGVSLTLPYDAKAGSYTTTLSFTVAKPIA